MVSILKHLKAFIIMLMFLAVMIGFYSFKTFPKEASPAINVPFFTVTVIYPWADPETIEKQVVEKLENNMSSIAKLKEVNSVSAYNVWVISLEFDRDKNISEAYSDINSAIDKTRSSFSDNVKEPIVKRVDVTDQPIYTFSVVWPYLSSVLYDKIRTLEDKIQATKWVSEVDVVGSYIPWVKVKFDYDKLLKKKINFSYAINQIQTYLDKFPADKKEIDNNLYTFTLRSYPDSIDNIADFLWNLSIVDKAWNSIILKDIADITVWPYMFKKETYLMDDESNYASITYFIKKVPWADILETIANVKQKVLDYWLIYSEKNFEPPKQLDPKEDLKELQVFEVASQKEKIDATYKTFISNFWQTSVIIFLVILLFIWFKESIAITLVFPLVYLIAFVVLKSIWYTFNNIVSFSLVLTLWIMVDNLIVVIEWFEEWQKKWLWKWESVEFSLKSYWKPIISWNFTTISMFLPIGFMLSGKIGDFMKYMPVTVDVVLIISIFVALVFLPVVLTSMKSKVKNPPIPNSFPQGEKGDFENSFSLGGKDAWKADRGLFNKLEWFFKFTIDNYKKSIFSFVVIIWITVFGASQFLKADFLPPVDTNNIYINLKFTSDTTLNENRKITWKIAEDINKYFRKHKDLLSFININIWDYRTLLPLDNVVYKESFNPDLSYLNLKLTDKDFQRNYSSVVMVQDLKKVIKKENYGEKLTSLEIFIQKSGPSGWKDVNFYLVWNKLEDLVNFYNKLEPKLKQIPWTYDWDNSLEYTNWKLDITWDIDKLKQFDISSKELDLLLASIQTSENYEPNGVLLKSLDDYSSDLIDVKAYTKLNNQDILNIIVPWRDIYLKQLIKNVEIKWEVKSLNHSNARLILNVWAYKTKETSLWSITPKIEEYIANIQKEIPGVSLEYAWDVKDMQNSMKDLLSAFGIGIILMFSVLVLHFGNFRQPFLVLSVIPLLFIGAIFALTLLWLPLSFPAQLGMFGLMWVWVNDAILLIERYNNEKDSKKKYKDNDDLILDVIRARFKPVLLTTLTTVLGLLTLAIKDELWWSLAVAFIWGLLLGTFIILVYIPSMLKWGLVRVDKNKNNSN